MARAGSARLSISPQAAAVGNVEKARFVVDKLLASAPGGTVSKWTAANFVPYAYPSDLEHLAQNLRLAGLPD